MSLILLPPTPRDFDIHHMSLVQLISTWRIAEKHGISQTRVRQVIARVSRWLATTIPVKTDLEIEQEARLAKHLAAEQLRHQIEQLQNFWDGSGDPKYLRQQTRVITALARLGTVPGTIDALAADATLGPYDPSEPQVPWSEDDPWANAVPSRNVVPSRREGQQASSILHPESVSPPNAAHPHSAVGRGFPDPAPPPTAGLPQSQIQNPQSQIPPPPPPGDFSAAPPSLAPTSHVRRGSLDPAWASNTARRKTSATSDTYNQQMLAGLNTMEQRLLTLIANTSSDEPDRLTSLQQTLDEVRDSKANYERELSSSQPPAPFTTSPLHCQAGLASEPGLLQAGIGVADGRQ